MMAKRNPQKARLKPAPQLPPAAPTPGRWYASWWFYLLLLAAFYLSTQYGENPVPREITWQEFARDLLRRQAVDRLEVINNEKVEVYLKMSLAQDTAFQQALKPVFGKDLNPGPHYQFSIGSVESFESKLDKAQQDQPGAAMVPVRYIRTSNKMVELLIWLFPLFLIIVLGQYLLRRMGGGPGGTSIFSFGRSTAHLMEKGSKSPVTFEEVAGLEEAKVEIKEIVDFLKDPSAYTRLGAKIPKGIIIVGPPGTGKTLLVKAVAGEAQVPFFSISGSEFVEMFVGVGASRVRDLFRQAKEKVPCIVFIDEIDAVGRSRGKNAAFTGANDERESTLNQLLTEMDGFGTNSGVIVIAATNRADMLDPALLRPGRFDRHIYLELPNLHERQAIFQVHLRPLVLEPSLDLAFLAAQTPGFSGADIANICNEAALIAARRKKDQVGRQDFLDAIDRVVAGLERKSRIITPAEKKIVACHEAGHAVVSWLLPSVDPLSKVSIIPRGKSLGAAWYLPEERQLRTAAELGDRLCAALGGRAAEEVMLGEVSSGGLDDLEKVTRDAYMMVAYYGFNKKVGHTSFYDSTGQHEAGFQKPYSEETGRLIDEEVRKLVEEAYQKTKELLSAHRNQLSQLAELLLQKEVVYRDDLEQVLGSRPAGQAAAPASPVVESRILPGKE
ncbi:MAG: ATP-dependent zinc metalloprotease FtsH [Adhaeribacter sp.]